MSRRMRRPETVKIDLSQNDWILIKKHLTAGEQRAVFAYMMRADGDAIDRVKVGLAKIVGYLLDWSIQDADGKDVVIRDQPANVIEAALNALDVDCFREILKAIETHEEAMAEALEQEKNAQATGSASSAT